MIIVVIYVAQMRKLRHREVKLSKVIQLVSNESGIYTYAGFFFLLFRATPMAYALFVFFFRENGQSFQNA